MVKPDSASAATDRRAARVSRVLDVSVVCVGAAFVGVFVWIVAQRIAYPYGLEWLEGAMLQHARRAALSLPLYTAPTLDYTPFIYPPMYAWLGSALTALVPPGMFALRLMSVAATLVTMALLYRLTRDETRSAFAGALSAALYIAMYRITVAWYDVARVDAVFVALLLAGVTAARRARTARG